MDKVGKMGGNDSQMVRIWSDEANSKMNRGRVEMTVELLIVISAIGKLIKYHKRLLDGINYNNNVSSKWDTSVLCKPLDGCTSLTHHMRQQIRQSCPICTLGRFTFPRAQEAHVRQIDGFSVWYTYPTDISRNPISYLGSVNFLQVFSHKPYWP